jgi:hypothetical protein
MARWLTEPCAICRTKVAHECDAIAIVLLPLVVGGSETCGGEQPIRRSNP